MNPFLAKLVATYVGGSTSEDGINKDGWKEQNQTVVIFGWDGMSGTVLLADEKGTLEVLEFDKIRLRLPNNADILPAGLLQQMQRKVS